LADIHMAYEAMLPNPNSRCCLLLLTVDYRDMHIFNSLVASWLGPCDS